MSDFDRCCRDFGVVYLVAAVAMILLGRVLGTAGIAIDMIAALIPLTVAAFFAGARHAERTGRRPGIGQSWAFALCGTATAVVITFCLAAAALASAGPQAREIAHPLIAQPAVFVMLLAVMATAHLLALRYVFALAAARALHTPARVRVRA